MNEKELEFEELSLEQIMQEFGSSEQVLTPEEETAEHGFRDYQELLDAVSGAKDQKEKEPEVPESEDTQPEDTQPEDTQPETAAQEQPAQEIIPEPEAALRPEAEESEAGEDAETVYIAEDAEKPEDSQNGSQEEESRENEPVPAVNLDDTVRLDSISDVKSGRAVPLRMDDSTARIGSIWDEEEPVDEDEEPVEFIIAPPIIFRPRQKLRELKQQLIAGPEKRYYELSERGVGKLQIAMLVCVLVVLISAAAGLMYGAGMIPESRMRLMVFSQVLIMLIGALMGSQEMIEGVSDLFHGRFTLNTLLTITFLASCADGVFCLLEQRVPICAAFTLEVAMALWSRYQRRTTEMGQMDTMRKAVRLEGLATCENYCNDSNGFLRKEGQVEDFMDSFDEITRPERIQCVFAVLSLLVSIAVAVFAGIRHSVSMGVQIFSTTLLVAVPTSFFVALSRPMAVLERRLHSLGTVICGWSGIKGLNGRGVFAVYDGDLFPAGTAKMNGVKFYGSRDPEVTIAYAAALMRVNGGTLASAFDQLLTSRSGVRYAAEKLIRYGNGGIGGEILGEPVLMGTLDFLKDMGVEIPGEVMVKQAVYVAIDGELSGLFAISYSRMKHAANGLATLCANRKLKTVILSEDFLITAPFLKEKFGVSTRRMIFPTQEEHAELTAKQPDEDAKVLAMSTQTGLAPLSYALSGARALRTSWRLGLTIHIVGGILGMLIMLALAILGSVELLTPFNILMYQLIWMIPGLLVTLWPRTI